MVVLIDTNVAINYLTNRADENSVASSRLITLCGEGVVEGYIASHSVPVIWYVLRKYPEKDRRTLLRNLCTVLSVVGASQEDVMTALDREDFIDFEDCLQDQCAQDIEADYIVTCNVRDFDQSFVPGITPIDFLKLMEEN
jgi:predicted nucleic acid-binding protein